MMDDSHTSLRDDYEVSTPGLDRAAAALPRTLGRLRRSAHRSGVRRLRRRPRRRRRSPRRRMDRAAGRRRDGHSRVSASPSRASAPGVRTPHQKRSLPSTKVTGATRRSSASCRGPNGIGLGRREHGVDVVHVVERDLGIPLGRAREHVRDAEVREHRRAIRVARSSSSTVAARSGRTLASVPAARAEAALRRRRCRPTRASVASAWSTSSTRVDAHDVHLEAGGFERLEVLFAVLLVVHHHEVRRERHDLVDVGILRAADVRQLGVLAEARDRDRARCPTRAASR